MNYPNSTGTTLIAFCISVLCISCTDVNMKNKPAHSFESREVFEENDIYLVAFEIVNANRVNLLTEALKEQARTYSQEYTDSLQLNDRKLHYYFYSSGAKIPPFSKVSDYSMVEDLLWVNVKSFDSPLLEWTNSFDSVGAVYEWKLD